ncbi:MAG: hypothetical protein ACYCVD_14265 [Desulfitobacteriaceae bacterium]
MFKVVTNIEYRISILVDEEEGYRKIRRIPLGGLTPQICYKSGE